MQFNSEANGLDLYSDARFLCGIDETSDTTSYPIKAFTRNANFASDVVLSWILKGDGNWKFDDTNQTGELLDVSNNLVSGTQKTPLSVTWLTIERVRIKDASGNWITLPELNRKAQTDSQLTATSGTPSSYFHLGNYLYFDKAPSYNSTGGIEVQFQRGPSYFVYTDTTKTPGFAAPYHRLVSMMGALDYCDINTMADRVASLRTRIGTPPDLMNNQAGSGMAKELVDYYSRRDEDAKLSISPVKEDYGQAGLIGGGATSPRGF
jgi:hypothetical protein